MLLLPVLVQSTILRHKRLSLACRPRELLRLHPETLLASQLSATGRSHRSLASRSQQAPASCSLFSGLKLQSRSSNAPASTSWTGRAQARRIPVMQAPRSRTSGRCSRP